MDCSYERLARQRLGFPQITNGQPKAFSAKVLRIEELREDELIAVITAFNRRFTLRAHGKCAKICRAFLMPLKWYTFSGFERIRDYIDLELMCEISRPKPPFTEFDNIYEKLVDVNFLERMVQTREILNDEHLCDLLEERYYVYATILAFESWPKTYQACNNPQCYAAKVVLGDSYNYKCRKCENESVYFDPVLLAKIVLVDPERLPLRPVQDHLPRRGQPVRPPVITTAVFQQAAESVLGRTTAELNDLFVKKNKEEFREVCGRAISRKLVFRLRANVFQDQIGFNVDRVFA